MTDAAQTLVANLEQIALEEEDDEDISVEAEMGGEEGKAELELPSGEGRSVLCVGARSALDDVTAAMLAQVLAVQGRRRAGSAMKTSSLPTSGV